MDNVFISIGNINIYYYSLFIMISIIVSSIILILNCRNINISKDKMFDIIFYTIIIGIIGARSYYVIFNFNYYKNNLLEIFYVWNGGLAIHGGLISGFLFLFFYCRKYNIKIIKLLDLVSICLLVSQAIGRWGNFFNKEAYGSVVSKDFLDKFLPGFIVDNMYIDGFYHHPCFLYESILCFIGFIIIYIIYKKKIFSNGKYLGFYLIYYGIIRIFIEILRVDSLMFFNLKFAIIVSISFIIIGIYLMLRRNNHV